MTGKAAAILIVATALIAGAAMYWLQVHAFYDEVRLAADGGRERPLVTRDGVASPLPVSAFRGIDAESSPIRFRACLTVPPGTDGDAYPGAVPLVAPGWFDCFDAETIGSDLESGAARAVLSEADHRYGIDRVMAVYPDGRAYIWPQINACGRELFDGNPLPPDCPAPPREMTE